MNPLMSRRAFTFGAVTLHVDVGARPEEGQPLFDDGELTGDAFDDTGIFYVWPASVSLCRWLEGQPLPTGRVLELGCGAGLPARGALGGAGAATGCGRVRRLLITTVGI